MLFAGYSRPIMLTSPCNVDPLTPNFYIVKVGFTGVYIFLMFALKHKLWLEPKNCSISHRRVIVICV